MAEAVDRGERGRGRVDTQSTTMMTNTGPLPPSRFWSDCPLLKKPKIEKSATADLPLVLPAWWSNSAQKYMKKDKLYLYRHFNLSPAV